MARLLPWFAEHARDLPWRQTSDPYAVWVSEIMLQQTQVRTVIPYFERWMSELPTIADLSRADSARLHKLWEGLGYYTRVRNMQAAARQIMAEHQGIFPSCADDVLALPGIGRYTAGAICSIAFNQPAPILDGNVIRVLTRLFGISSSTREKATVDRLWAISENLVSVAATSPWSPGPGVLPKGPCSALNQSLMELGALICTPKAPRCADCPARGLCVARNLGCAEEFPNVGPRPSITKRRFAACVIRQNGTVLVRQRPAGVVNAHLWEFPNAEVELDSSEPSWRRALEQELGCELAAFDPILTLQHSITRYRITLHAFAATLNGTAPGRHAGQWVPTRDLPRLAFTSAHRRILVATQSQENLRQRMPQ